MLRNLIRVAYINRRHQYQPRLLPTPSYTPYTLNRIIHLHRARKINLLRPLFPTLASRSGTEVNHIRLRIFKRLAERGDRVVLERQDERRRGESADLVGLRGIADDGGDGVAEGREQLREAHGDLWMPR